jgi:hypothetical protein
MTAVDVELRPRWLLQYHGHHRNCVLHVPPRGAQG